MQRINLVGLAQLERQDAGHYFGQRGDFNRGATIERGDHFMTVGVFLVVVVEGLIFLLVFKKCWILNLFGFILAEDWLENYVGASWDIWGRVEWFCIVLADLFLYF